MFSNAVTKILKIANPIIQAPMLGVTTPSMVAAATAADCLGSLPLADLPPKQCSLLIHETKKLIKAPFAVNLFLHTIPEKSDVLRTKYTATKFFLEEIAASNGMKLTLPEIDDLILTDYKDQINTILECGCKILSFTFGLPDSDTIQLLKQNDTILIGTCTSVEEAIVLENAGIDLICVQGIEAGGHQGGFTEYNTPLRGGFSLLSQVYDNVRVPLIYAGGIYNGRTLKAAQTLGAQGFQTGSLLLCSLESALMDFEKERLKKAHESEIVFTKSFSGKTARGIRNKFIDFVEESPYILPYPFQNKITAPIRNIARTMKMHEFTNLWTGQSLHTFSFSSTTHILQKLLQDAGKID